MRVAKTVTNQVASAASLVQKELKTRSRTEDGGKKHKRDCGGESTGAGGFQCSAATSLTLPRIFTFPTVVFNLIARVPSAIAAAALSFEDATNLTEISEVLEAILDGDALPSATETLGARKTICVSNGYNDATACFSDKSAASSLSIPRIFTFPIAVFNVVARIPGVLAAAIALPESSTLSRLGSKGLSSTPDADGTSEVHNERNTPEICVWDGIAGTTVCHPYQRDLNLNDVSSALGADLDPIELIQRATASTTPTKIDNSTVADVTKRLPPGRYSSGACKGTCDNPSSGSSSLRSPRIFNLPILAINAMTSIPGTIASAIPARINISTVADVTKRLPPPQYTSKACKGTCDNPSKSRAWSLGAPQIFRLPSLVFTAVALFPHTFAAVIPISGPRQFTQSLAAPSFDLVRKSTDRLLELVWIPGYGCGSEETSGAPQIAEEEINEGNYVAEAARKEDELRRRKIPSPSSRETCTNDVAFDGYCVQADAGRVEVRWAAMGVVGLAAVFCFFM